MERGGGRAWERWRAWPTRSSDPPRSAQRHPIAAFRTTDDTIKLWQMVTATHRLSIGGDQFGSKVEWAVGGCAVLQMFAVMHARQCPAGQRSPVWCGWLRLPPISRTGMLRTGTRWRLQPQSLQLATHQWMEHSVNTRTLLFEAVATVRELLCSDGWLAEVLFLELLCSCCSTIGLATLNWRPACSGGLFDPNYVFPAIRPAGGQLGRHDLPE